MEYSAARGKVRYRSDKIEGPTSGTETIDPLEFLARIVTHIPDKGQVMTRYYGWYANRPRGVRRKLAAGPEETPIKFAEREDLKLREARRRWAELLRKVFEVDPLKCPACGGAMRIISFITKQEVIDEILAHLSRKARSPP
jgi:hypothetical protein